MSDGSNQGVPSSEQPRVSLFGRRAETALAVRIPAAAGRAAAARRRPQRKKRSEGLSRLSGLLSFVLIAAVIVLGAFAFAMLEAAQAGAAGRRQGRGDRARGRRRLDSRSARARRRHRQPALVQPDVAARRQSRQAQARRISCSRQHASLREVEDVLVSGKVVLHKVTVPEGLTSDQVVQRLRDNDVFAGDIKEIPREGSILPETYEFERGVSRAKVLSVDGAARRPRRSTKSGRSARPICRSNRRANW